MQLAAFSLPALPRKDALSQACFDVAQKLAASYNWLWDTFHRERVPRVQRDNQKDTRNDQAIAFGVGCARAYRGTGDVYTAEDGQNRLRFRASAARSP